MSSVVVAELGVLRHREEEAMKAEIGKARLTPGAWSRRRLISSACSASRKD